MTIGREVLEVFGRKSRESGITTMWYEISERSSDKTILGKLYCVKI